MLLRSHTEDPTCLVVCFGGFGSEVIECSARFLSDFHRHRLSVRAIAVFVFVIAFMNYSKIITPLFLFVKGFFEIFLIFLEGHAREISDDLIHLTESLVNDVRKAKLATGPHEIVTAIEGLKILVARDIVVKKTHGKL